jgi:hypothetical protein
MKDDNSPNGLASGCVLLQQNTIKPRLQTLHNLFTAPEGEEPLIKLSDKEVFDLLNNIEWPSVTLSTCDCGHDKHKFFDGHARWCSMKERT